MKHIKEHKNKVKKIMHNIANDINNRAEKHDNSKLLPPEISEFSKREDFLETFSYNSKEYIESLEILKEALEHHYKDNDHHPEHFPNGINGMDLSCLVEMISDWYASSQNTKDGDVYKSIEVGKERFGLSEQLCDILKNTIKKIQEQEMLDKE